MRERKRKGGRGGRRREKIEEFGGERMRENKYEKESDVNMKRKPRERESE